MPLIVVPTPIGNLEDITLRSLRALRSADCIACEDTRRTRILCTRYALKKTLLSYHEHNERGRTEQILGYLREGKTVALVSDAGTPGISDPGEVLLREVIAQGLPLEILPGPTALIPGLLYSGLPARPFLFAGFLSDKKSERKKELEKLEPLEVTLIFYLSPHKAVAHLEDLEALLGNRPAALVREISKIHEEVLRFTLGELRGRGEETPFRGELVLVVEGKQPEPPSEDLWLEKMEELLLQERSPRDIVQEISEMYGVPKNAIKNALFSRKSR